MLICGQYALIILSVEVIIHGCHIMFCWKTSGSFFSVEVSWERYWHGNLLLMATALRGSPASCQLWVRFGFVMFLWILLRSFYLVCSGDQLDILRIKLVCQLFERE